MSTQFLAGARVLVGGAWLDGHGVLVRGGTIAAVLPVTDATAAGDRVDLPAGSLLSPGLVDVQVNGGGGLLFNDAPNAASAIAIADAHRALGTTSILPTLITDTPTAMARAADAVCEAVGRETGVLGIHYEGPFLAAGRPGVHDRALIRSPSEAELASLVALAHRLAGPVLLTLAPETVGDAALRRLAGAGIVLAAGHSAATYERANAALAAGITGFTHVFNAMPAASAREPGITAAALLDPASWCGVIADGIHVHPAMLRLLLAAKPASRVMLVSDAMPSVGSPLPGFMLQGRQVFRDHGRLALADGTLAGADICLADAVRFAVRLGLTAAQALTMATAVPAAFLRQAHRVGHIAAGARADLLLLNPALEVLGTWRAGRFLGGPDILSVRAQAA